MSADKVLARRAWLAAIRWARGRSTSEDETTTAFDAWWMSLQPSSQRVPDDAPSWWYGSGPEPGHRLYDRRGRLAQNRALDTLPLDGGYAPWHERPERRQPGQFKRSVVTSNGDVFTILAWWDSAYSSIDPGTSTCFIVRGDHAYESETMIAALPIHFPGQALKLAAAGIDLVEVAHEG
jgi:hypothetical protein